MSITLVQLGVKCDSLIHAQVQHGAHVFAALVNGSQENLEPLLGHQFPVEISFEKVANWRELSEFQDEDSCIKTDAIIQDAVVVRGRVHNVLPIDSASSVIDIYLQTGQEFIAIESNELGGFIPKIGTGLEIHVQGLCFYPTNI
ncbi:hypothetical protein [Massilia sp. erpn]|uniref:hypothetical protein n=1 Tax=Massilia sp. erpn TaxID=2738142 RepID=UPI00210769C3|nr:hypothetical protein [Massilia sp. erpn]UTY59561.1 hypothetical protein HPQ68_21715 [Massilia sp. erpn]